MNYKEIPLNEVDLFLDHKVRVFFHTKNPDDLYSSLSKQKKPFGTAYVRDFTGECYRLLPPNWYYYIMTTEDTPLTLTEAISWVIAHKEPLYGRTLGGKAYKLSYEGGIKCVFQEDNVCLTLLPTDALWRKTPSALSVRCTIETSARVWGPLKTTIEQLSAEFPGEIKIVTKKED